MATFTYPDWMASGAQWGYSAVEWGLRGVSMDSTSPYNGEMQTAEMVGSHRVIASITYPDHSPEERAPVEAFWKRLRGRVHRVRLFHPGRLVPRGSMRGEPYLAASAGQFADTLSIQTWAGASLLADDAISVGGQWFTAAADAWANAQGILTVPVVANVRTPLAGGTAVVWDKPRCMFMLASNEVRFPRRGAICPGFTLDLVEAFS